MIIKTLLENTTISDNLKTEHGLSLYIESNNNKILFDVGASDFFYQNSKELNVDISDIDYLVISHGHSDHGGGLKTFLEHNSKAKIIAHKKAFENYYAKEDTGNISNIGLNPSFKEKVTLISDSFSINENIEIFSNISHTSPAPISNKKLMMDCICKDSCNKVTSQSSKNNSEYNEINNITLDTFEHEQIMMIEENGKIFLFTGCAHNGIINIIEHFRKLKGKTPDYIIGGFHLYSNPNLHESNEVVDSLGKYLLETGATYYTCHCTGIEPFNRLKRIMGDKVHYLSTGSEIVI